MHTHHCECGEIIEAVDGTPEQCQSCIHGDKVYCHRHHPDPDMRREDPPSARMTVKVI